MDTTHKDRSPENVTSRFGLPDPALMQAERFLAEAGIAYMEVTRCPVAVCEVCHPDTVAAAA